MAEITASGGQPPLLPQAALLAANLAVIRSVAGGPADVLVEVADAGEPAPTDDAVATPTLVGTDTASGRVLLLNGRLLHSGRDPQREADRVIERAVTTSGATVVFIGMGGGFAVRRFLARHPEGRAVVVEPSAVVFAQMLSYYDLRDVLADPRVHILIEATEGSLTTTLRTILVGEVVTIVLPAYREVFPEFVQRTAAAVVAFASRRDINHNTIAKFSRLWVRNFARNLRRFASGPGICDLDGVLSGLPAVVVAAGPSLDEVLPRLPELAARCVVVAVDTAIAPCVAAGVVPDLVVVVDPQYWNTRHLDAVARQLPTDTLTAVCEPATNPRVFNLLGDRVVFGASLFPLGDFFECATGNKGRFGAGGSVATSAWDIARHTGTNPIFMAGLDLGFPRDHTHVRGSFFEDRCTVLSTRTAPAHTLAFRYLMGADPFFLPNNAGGTTRSDRRMNVYRWWFENQMTMHPDITTYTLSSHAVAIPGMQWCDWRVPMSRPVLDKATLVIAALARVTAPRTAQQAGGQVADCTTQQAANAIPPGTAPQARGCLRGRTEILRDSMRRMAALCDEAEGLARRLDEAAATRLNTIDAALLLEPAKDLVGFLIQPEIRRVTTDSAADDHGADLYAALADAARYHLAVFANDEC